MTQTPPTDATATGLKEAIAKAASRLRDRAAMYAATKPGQHDLQTVLAALDAAALLPSASVGGEREDADLAVSNTQADYGAILFDVLEAIKPHFPRIGRGFSRRTGDVDLPYIIGVLTPPPFLPDSTEREVARALLVRAAQSHGHSQVARAIKNGEEPWYFDFVVTAMREFGK